MPEITVTASAKLNAVTHSRSIKREIDDNLPPDVIGKGVCDAVADLWKDGFDPTEMEIAVSFS